LPLCAEQIIRRRTLLHSGLLPFLQPPGEIIIKSCKGAQEPVVFKIYGSLMFRRASCLRDCGYVFLSALDGKIKLFIPAPFPAYALGDSRIALRLPHKTLLRDIPAVFLSASQKSPAECM